MRTSFLCTFLPQSLKRFNEQQEISTILYENQLHIQSSNITKNQHFFTIMPIASHHDEMSPSAKVRVESGGVAISAFLSSRSLWTFILN